MDSASHSGPSGLPILPPDLHHLVVHELAPALSPPSADAPDDCERRGNALVARVAALRPADADEATLACQYIAAAAQALDCLRLARQFPNDSIHVLKCAARATSMMREARAARAQLERLRAGARPDRARSKAPSEPARQQPDHGADITPAEKYALANPAKAALIRSLGRLPKKFDDPGVTPELVRDIVASPSPILQALVKRPAHRLAA
jgi:hypothetical protein